MFLNKYFYTNYHPLNLLAFLMEFATPLFAAATEIILSSVQAPVAAGWCPLLGYSFHRDRFAGHTIHLYPTHRGYKYIYISLP